MAVLPFICFYYFWERNKNLHKVVINLAICYNKRGITNYKKGGNYNMSEELRYNFPPLQEVAEKEKVTTLDELWDAYIEALIASAEMTNQVYANKLLELKQMLQQGKLRKLEKEFHELKRLLGVLVRKYNIKIQISRRQKDFIGINEKIRLYLMDEKPLSKMQDFLGFRLVLCTDKEDSPDSISLCYEVMNELIRYFVSVRKCIITEAEPIIGIGLERSKHPEIVIPEKSLIMPGFENNVKDYVISPKRNGYQGLHVLIRKPDGLVFELQVRTLAMDIRARYGMADHSNYKIKKYEDVKISLDFDKLHIQGVVVLPDGKIYDTVGLVESIDPFNLL